MADRADWDAATRAQRHLAVAADAELRRRHPDQHYPPLRSAEPQPATEAQRDELTLTAEQPIRRDGPVDQRPRRRPPHVRRHARRTAEPDHPVRGSRLRRPRPGVPALARTGQGRHLATAQTRDPPVPAGPPACRGPRRRPGGRGLTAARCGRNPGGSWGLDQLPGEPRSFSVGRGRIRRSATRQSGDDQPRAAGSTFSEFCLVLLLSALSGSRPRPVPAMLFPGSRRRLCRRLQGRSTTILAKRLDEYQARLFSVPSSGSDLIVGSYSARSAAPCLFGASFGGLGRAGVAVCVPDMSAGVVDRRAEMVIIAFCARCAWCSLG